MQAVAVLRAGSPAEVIEIEPPMPTGNEIRVELWAAGVNPVDGKMASGAYGHLELPFIPGIDGAGRVDMLGERSVRFSVGDRVYGRMAHAGRGTYAEYVVVPDTEVIARIPDGVDFETAAAIPVAGLTALGVLHSLSLPAGSRLLVLGATGGVGVFLTQLAARQRLHVIATARPELAEKTRGLGATTILDHTSSTSLSDQLSTLDVAPLDAVADLVGDQQLVEDMSRFIRPGGRLISTAGAVDPGKLAPGKITGSRYKKQPTVEMLQEMGALVQSGEVRVPIERRLGLGDGPWLLEESRSGHMHGKTILRIRDHPADR